MQRIVREPTEAELAGLPFRDFFFLGLDLGQSMDFSALVGLRRRIWSAQRGLPAPSPRYAVRGIKRWPLRTPYPQIVADVASLVDKPPLSGCILGVDRTGCGQPVVDMLRAAKPLAQLVPVLITAGHAATREGGGWHVPKMELCSAVNVLLQTSRLEIPGDLDHAATLGKELLAFRAKITAKGNEIAEADWRERAHDDMVLALAIAAWLGERTPYGRIAPPYMGIRGPASAVGGLSGIGQS